MSRVGGIQDHLAMGEDVSGQAAVDHGRRHQTETRVVVLMVVLRVSASSKATGLDFMEEPRSAWTVSWPGTMSRDALALPLLDTSGSRASYQACHD